MKQLILGLAACALIMSSCTQQEITENVTDGQGQLSFSTGLGKQSARTAELMNQSMKDAATAAANGVALRAYQETAPEGPFKQWYDDKLWYDETDGWKIESVRFRNEAKTKYITYFSMAKDGTDQPLLKEVGSTFTDATFVDLSDNFPQFTYKVNTTSINQEDLIAGITEVPANQTDITLGLRHILSQVNFGTVGYFGAKIVIQNIQIVGLYNSATYTYHAADTYPIGDWSKHEVDGAEDTKTATYKYYGYSNTDVAFNPQPEVPVGANKGDIYIFGDGGNWGPGKKANTLYPNRETGVWVKGDEKTLPKKLDNSLMLLPQDLENAKVTFEYQITDKSNVFVAGAGGPGEDDWAKGEFKLDFTTGKDPDDAGLRYLGKWDQNYRYVYLIDFTDFLDGNALTFTVDVEMYPWENYNGDGDDDGIVDIMAAGQPSAADMNHEDFTNGNTWYIATQSETAPTTPPTTSKTDWAQVIRDEVWNLSTYDFTQIVVKEKFNLSFQNVIFNTKETTNTPTTEPTTITLTLPEGFSATPKTGAPITVTAAGTNTWTISEGDKSANAFVVINNDYYYRTSATLKTGIEAVVIDKQKFAYGGREAVDLRTMAPKLTTVDNTITVKFISLVTPTVGVTANGGVWTWDAVNQIATWKMVTWSAIDAAKTAFLGAASNTTIYCSDNTLINLSDTFGEPTATNSPVSVVFKSAAARTPGATTNGVWSYSATTQTATWTKKP